MARRQPGPRRAARAGMSSAVLAMGVAACGSSHPATAVDAPPAPTWWQPQVGQVKNWDIQLMPGGVDVSEPRVMYDLDLWSLVPVDTMIDYGDGKPVMVPAGALAGVIAQLHARTPSTIVVCHIEVGALEMNRPDAGKFPDAAIGAGAPPDLLTAHVLDVSAAGRAAWTPIMFKRFDLAQRIGCDGVEPAHADVAALSGDGFFTVSPEDNLSWYTEIATQGHMHFLSTGMKGGDEEQLSGAIDKGASQFDWLMTERCGEHTHCDAAKPFLDQHKPVFAIDYNMDDGMPLEGDPRPPAPQLPLPVCSQQAMSNIADGIFKDVPPSKAVWMSCPDVAAAM